MDEKELGKRIKLERAKWGLTQEKVENLIGLPQKALTRIESGERSPSTMELAKLAEVFHISIGDFFRDVIEEDPLLVLHRSAPGLEQNPEIQEEVHRCLKICKEGIFLEKLLNQPSKQRVQFSLFEKPLKPIEAIKQGEQAAKDERKRLGLGSMPIHDIIELCDSQGIWCAATYLPDEMSGLFLCKPSIGIAILINANHSNSRQRFSCAHEYAHAIFDAIHPVLVSETKNAPELIEKRANAFAAAFLMPEEGIAEKIKSFNKGFSSRINFSTYDVSTQEEIEAEERHNSKNQKITPYDVVLIARHFNVSYQATVYRLHTLNYLAQEQKESLLNAEHKVKEYIRFLDNEDIEQNSRSSINQRELKAHVSRLIIEAYRQEKISRGRVIELCKLLKLSPEGFMDFAHDKNE